jgi:hypothetical protein
MPSMAIIISRKTVFKYVSKKPAITCRLSFVIVDSQNNSINVIIIRKNHLPFVLNNFVCLIFWLCESDFRP